MFSSLTAESAGVIPLNRLLPLQSSFTIRHCKPQSVKLNNTIKYTQRIFRQNKKLGHRYVCDVPTTNIIIDSASLHEVFDRMLFEFANGAAMLTCKTVQFRENMRL